jgi:hypothetical protein
MRPRAATSHRSTGTASLLREGSRGATCPRLQTPPLHLGGLRRYHVPICSGPRLAIQKGSGATTRPSAPSPAPPLRRGPALTHVHWLRTALASEVGSSADMCPMVLHMLWAIEIKEGLAPTTCSEARVFLRHAHSLPMRLQDVRADGIIMTYKP